MVKGELLKKDWFVALVFSLLFLIGVFNGAAFLEGLADLGLTAKGSGADNIRKIQDFK